MPQSLVTNYIHIVFSTKHRQCLIQKDIQEELYAYISGICRELECYTRAIGGIEDHIHILCLLSKKISLTELIRKIKANSSKWIKFKGEAYKNFYWQSGYGAFSVNPAQVDIVVRYINSQEEHHKKRTFQQELLLFLKKYEVQYEEKYLWD